MNPDPKPVRKQKNPMTPWEFRKKYASKKKSQKTDKQRAKDRADEAFSEFIRLRDIGNGCCTCNTPISWHRNDQGKIIVNGDAGHFITRDNEHTRYHERNANLQCRGCNRFESGKQYEHGNFIDDKYGPGTAQEILNISKWPPSKRTTYDYRMIAKEFKMKAQILRENLW